MRYSSLFLMTSLIVSPVFGDDKPKTTTDGKCERNVCFLSDGGNPGGHAPNDRPCCFCQLQISLCIHTAIYTVCIYMYYIRKYTYK